MFMLSAPLVASVASLKEAYPAELLLLMAEAAEKAAMASGKVGMKPVYVERPFWEHPAGPSEHYGF